MPTVINILNDIEQRLPNDFSTSVRLTWLNEVQRKIAKYLHVESHYDFVASSSVEYALSTNIRTENILSVYTGDSTKIADISSTTVWQLHEWSGRDDTLEGYKYYVPDIAHFNSTGWTTNLCLYPESTEVRVARIYYETLLADLTTAASTNQPLFKEEWHDVLKYGTMSIMAKAGNDPDIELANNYEREYKEILRDIKKDHMRKQWKRPRVHWNYAEHTWG